MSQLDSISASISDSMSTSDSLSVSESLSVENIDWRHYNDHGNHGGRGNGGGGRVNSTHGSIADRNSAQDSTSLSMSISDSVSDSQFVSTSDSISYWISNSRSAKIEASISESLSQRGNESNGDSTKSSSRHTDENLRGINDSKRRNKNDRNLYEDSNWRKSAEDKAEHNQRNRGGRIPKTGDNARMSTYLGMTGVSTAVWSMLAAKRKRRKKHGEQDSQDQGNNEGHDSNE